MSSRSSSASGMSAALSVTIATRRSVECAECCCRCMSSAFSPATVPNRAATRNTSDGIVGVDVHANLAVQARDHQAAADRRQLFPQVSPVDAFAGDDALGAVPVREFVLAAAGRQFLGRAGDQRRRASGRLRVGAAFQIVGHALDQLDESLRARVDDVRLAQCLQLERRLRQRRLRTQRRPGGGSRGNRACRPCAPVARRARTPSAPSGSCPRAVRSGFRGRTRRRRRRLRRNPPGRSGSGGRHDHRGRGRIARGSPPSCRARHRARHRLRASASCPRAGRATCAATPSTAFTVSARFVPVSPSGTGNTLILFRCSWRDSSRRMPACSAKFSRSPSRLSAVTAAAFTGDRLPSVQSLDSLNRLPRKFSTAPSGVICSTSGPSASVSPSLYLRELTKMNRCCGCVT